MKRMLCIAAVVVVLGSSVFAMPLLAPGDFIIAIDLDGNSSCPGSGAENAPMAIDGDVLTKYLNFGKENSGFIVTPSMGPTIVESFQITTADDAVERDPVAYWLSATNVAIVSPEHSRGIDEGRANWVTIGVGWITLPDDRLAEGAVITLPNPAGPYTSYRMQFLTVKDGVAANSMQIAEIQFFGTPEPATFAVLGLGGLGLLLRRRS